MIWLLLLVAAAFAVGGGASSSDKGPADCGRLLITKDLALSVDTKGREIFARVQADPSMRLADAFRELLRAAFPGCPFADDTIAVIAVDPGINLPSVGNVTGVQREISWQQIRQTFGDKTFHDFLPNGLEGSSGSIGLVDLLARLFGPGPIIEPPRPPTPTEGTSAPPEPTPDPVDEPVGERRTCDRTKADGDAEVCLRRMPSGRWSWIWRPADGSDPILSETWAKNAAEATVVAYLAGATRPVAYVVAEPISRAGTRLETDGTITVIDAATWGAATEKRIRSEWTQGERSPMGLVLAALQTIYPGGNWFRMKPPGGLEGAATRVQSVVSGQANAPDIADRIARAIVGAEYDAKRHVYRGRLVELKANAQGFYAYRVDGGPWIGAYLDFNDAVSAAHGGG